MTGAARRPAGEGGLASRRLVLRLMAGDDAQALFDAIEASRDSLRRWMRWVDAVQDAEDCRSFILRNAAAGPEGPLALGVFEARSGLLAGVASLQGVAEDGRVAALSLWIRADRRGRGYGLEAGAALAAHCFKAAGVRRLHARLEPANRAGRKVLQGLGFTYEGCLRRSKRLNGRWVDQECWGLLKEEWHGKSRGRGGRGGSVSGRKARRGAVGGPA